MIRVLGFMAALVVVAFGLGGCAPSLPPGTRACVGFPAEVCQRHVAELEQEGMTHGGVAAYRIVCTSGQCTVERGEGTLTVVFADGTGREGGFGYAVPVGPPPGGTEPPLTVVPACLGVPRAKCEEFARAGASDSVPAGQTVASITVRCTKTCTETNGDGETLVTLTDGTTRTSGWQYRQGGVRD